MTKLDVGPCPGCGDPGPHNPIRVRPDRVECSCGDSWTLPDADTSVVEALDFWQRKYRDAHLSALDANRLMRAQVAAAAEVVEAARQWASAVVPQPFCAPLVDAVERYEIALEAAETDSDRGTS